MQNTDAVAPKLMFVLVVREVLVAQDIAMTISDLRPDAEVVIARTLDEAAVAAPPGRIVALFVQHDTDGVLASDLGRRVAEAGGRLVILGQDPELPGPEGPFFLAFPFSREDVAAVLPGAAPA